MSGYIIFSIVSALIAIVYALVTAKIILKKNAGSAKIRQRVDYELKVIKDKGYSPYFLVVSDLLRFAKSVGILSTTRGSAGGSMVSYLTHITTVNPMEYDLPFERFLNPERPLAIIVPNVPI
jgi:DNA polymerase III alpha subunit